MRLRPLLILFFSLQNDEAEAGDSVSFITLCWLVVLFLSNFTYFCVSPPGGAILTIYLFKIYLFLCRPGGRRQD